MRLSILFLKAEGASWIDKILVGEIGIIFESWDIAITPLNDSDVPWFIPGRYSDKPWVVVISHENMVKCWYLNCRSVFQAITRWWPFYTARGMNKTDATLQIISIYDLCYEELASDKHTAHSHGEMFWVFIREIKHMFVFHIIYRYWNGTDWDQGKRIHAVLAEYISYNKC